MSDVRGQIRQAQQDLIRRLQEPEANFEEVATLWRNHWNIKLPKNRDDIFLIEDTARAGRIHVADAQILVKDCSENSNTWFHRHLVLVGCFILVISFWLLSKEVWSAMLVVCVVGCLLSYFDYLRSIWPRIFCTTASGSILAAGIAPIALKVRIGNGSSELWWFETIFNENQSEWFSCFLVATGLIGIFCSFKFIK